METDSGATDYESGVPLEPLDGSFLDVSEQEIESTDGRFECEICKKVYKLKKSLKRHLLIHDDRFEFRCKQCTRFFERKEQLDEHKQKIHVKNHMCVECGQQFYKKDHLNTHVKVKHAVLQSDVLVCPFDKCGKTFMWRNRYQDHLNMHSGQKPYTCFECNRAFHNRYSKNRHESVCSGKTNTTCSICNVDFADSSSLKRHTDAAHKMIRHTCDNCFKTFRHQSSLMRHRKFKHNGQYM